MSRKITLNEEDMRPNCEHNALVTCGTCQRQWCDVCTPTPSARCPFEYEHDDTFDVDYEAEFLDYDEVTKLVPRLLPHIGMKVCYHDDYHGVIVEILDAGDVKLDNGQVADFRNCCVPLPHSLEYGTAHACPTCGEYLGFHGDAMHRKDIDPKYLKEKGWHHV